eukprot:Gb_07410 [translate_table: standard]
MASEGPELEERLQAQLVQLRRECRLFERLMYKNKNQHRTCLYYRNLSKVRRDLRLFQSAGLPGILKKNFQGIGGNGPPQTITLLERLKTRSNVANGHNFQERLLGVARLLAQMIEPIIKAGLQISTLLGQTFFTTFALTMLALLARLRVLLQQTLQDIVCIFNMSCSVSQGEQSARLTEDGAVVFRDNYPPIRPFLILECHWDGVKFCLHEKFDPSKKKNADLGRTLLLDNELGNDVHSLPKVSTTKNSSIEASDGGGDPSITAAAKNKMKANENASTQIRKVDFVVNKSIDHNEPSLLDKECSKDVIVGKDSSKANGLSNSFHSQCSKTAEHKSARKRKVAFISVNAPSKMEAKSNKSGKKLRAGSNNDPSKRSPSSAKETADPFFDLLYDGNKN